MYESSTKELSGCASNLLAHEDLGHFEEAHHWNIQGKFYNEKFPLVYESDKIISNTSSILIKAIMSSQNNMAKESYPYKII